MKAPNYRNDGKSEREEREQRKERSEHLLPTGRPVILHPTLQQSQHVHALVDAAEFGQLGDRLLVVAQQKLLRGAVSQRALCLVLQQRQFIITHPPTAGKILPVFDSAVGGI